MYAAIKERERESQIWVFQLGWWVNCICCRDCDWLLHCKLYLIKKKKPTKHDYSGTETVFYSKLPV